MTYNKQNCIVRTSKNQIYKFYIENQNLIIEKINIRNEENKTILREGIIDFSLDIDENDKIHVVYTKNKRELVYTQYPEDIDDINIIKVDYGWTIDSIKVKSIGSNINIFYRSNDLFKSTSYICHKYLCKEKWLDKITAQNYISPYFIDNHGEYIYILYCKSRNTGEYKIRKFYLTNDNWDNLEDNMIIKDADNVNFFITPDNIGIISFNKIIENNLQVLIRYKNFNVENSSWSCDINISKSSINAFKPISFYKNDNTYIMWDQGNHIVYRKSKNLSDWSKEYVIPWKDENINKLLYISNDLKNHVLDEASIDLSETLQRNANYSNTKEELKNKASNQINSLFQYLMKEFKLEREILLANIKIKKDDIEALLNKIQCQNKTITSLEDNNLNLRNEIDTLNDSIEEYEEKFNELKVEKNSDYKLKSQNIANYESEIIKLKEEKDRLMTEIEKRKEENINIRKKIESLNNLIEEYEEKFNRLKVEKDSAGKFKSQNITYYESEIIKLKEEKDRLIAHNKNYCKKIFDCESEINELREEKEEYFMDSNLKIYSLLKIIEEKENIIKKLYRIVKVKFRSSDT